MIKKILLTIFVIIFPVAGIGMVTHSFLGIFGAISSNNIWTIIEAIIGFIFLILPGWLMWKGTKLIPFITILPIRIIMLILGMIFFPLGIIFALIGIWFKS